MKVLNLLKVLRLFVKCYPTKKVVFQTKDGIIHPIESFCLDPVTGFLFLSEFDYAKYYRSLSSEKIEL